MSPVFYVYSGARKENGEPTVVRDGDCFECGPSLRVWNHSPCGFEWGYGGSGPAQLSLAILLDHFSCDLAVLLHQRFKSEIIAKLARDGWTITSALVIGWCAGIYEELQQTRSFLGG